MRTCTHTHPVQATYCDHNSIKCLRNVIRYDTGLLKTINDRQWEVRLKLTQKLLLAASKQHQYIEFWGPFSILTYLYFYNKYTFVSIQTGNDECIHLFLYTLVSSLNLKYGDQPLHHILVMFVCFSWLHI